MTGRAAHAATEQMGLGSVAKPRSSWVVIAETVSATSAAATRSV